MPSKETIATLFELAITAEKAAQDFYRGLMENYSHLPEVSELWKGMLDDEIRHAQILEKIRDTLTLSELSTPAPPSLLRNVRRVLGILDQERLKSVNTLDDAYKLAHELENSEFNTLFEILIRRYISSDESKKLILSELENHLPKLMNFSKTFRQGYVFVERGDLILRRE